MENEEVMEKINFICEDNAEKAFTDFPLSYLGSVLESDPYFLSDQQYANFNKVDQTTCLDTFEKRKYELRSCLINELRNSENSGNTFIPYSVLNNRIKRILSENKHVLSGSIYPYLNFYNGMFYYNDKHKIVSFNESYQNEIIIRDFVTQHLDQPSNFIVQEIPDNIDNEKKEILRTIQNQRLNIVTGGPGTGKTTWLRLFIDSVPITKNIVVCAPTGKASRRAAEVLADMKDTHENLSTMTIHKFLGYGHNLSRAEKMKIQSVDILIIDESSMLDDEITSLLFSNIGNTKMSVIFVGDINQLPSVGVGNLLYDLQTLGVKTYTLTKNFRTDNITLQRNNDKILSGDSNLIWDDSFQLKPLNEVYNSTSDIILSPYVTESKDYSARAINEIYRANKWHDDRQFHVTDEVIFLDTSYPNGYMNGDTGVILRIEADAYYVLLDYNLTCVKVEDESQMMLVHTITIHKSQGSEYNHPSIILPDFNEDFTTRNLLYTGITRAKNQVTLYSTPEILEQIICNPMKPRNTFISLGL